MNCLLVAEVKTQSPFGFRAEKSWDELFDVANKYGDWLSIHTDSRWGGSFEHIKLARSRTCKPILAKGIHETDDLAEEAIKSGADNVLVVGRIPRDEDLARRCWFEPISKENLKENFHLVNEFNIPVVWNQRDLKTGQRKEENIEAARYFTRLTQVRLVQASFIKTKNDVSRYAYAIIVGENLLEFLKS